MEIQLKELIEKVKSDGIEEGKKQAAELKNQAVNNAGAIIREAEKKSEAIINHAKNEAEKIKKDAEESIKIASRDLILKVDNKIKEIFNRIILEETGKALNNDLVKDVVVKLMNAWEASQAEDTEIKLPEKDFAELSGFFKTKLANQLKKGLKIIPDRSIDKGFAITIKQGAVSYDFTARTVADIISINLTPEISALLQEAHKGE